MGAPALVQSSRMREKPAACSQAPISATSSASPWPVSVQRPLLPPTPRRSKVTATQPWRKASSRAMPRMSSWLPPITLYWCTMSVAAPFEAAASSAGRPLAVRATLQLRGQKNRADSVPPAAVGTATSAASMAATPTGRGRRVQVGPPARRRAAAPAQHAKSSALPASVRLRCASGSGASLARHAAACAPRRGRVRPACARKVPLTRRARSSVALAASARRRRRAPTRPASSPRRCAPRTWLHGADDGRERRKPYPVSWPKSTPLPLLRLTLGPGERRAAVATHARSGGARETR